MNTAMSYSQEDWHEDIGALCGEFEGGDSEQARILTYCQQKYGDDAADGDRKYHLLTLVFAFMATHRGEWEARGFVANPAPVLHSLWCTLTCIRSPDPVPMPSSESILRKIH